MNHGRPAALESLYLLVHPGYSIETYAELTDDGRELLETCIDVATTIDRTREALIVISHKTHADIHNIQTSGTANIEWPIVDALHRMDAVLRGNLGVLAGARHVDKENCSHRLEDMRQLLEDMRFRITEHTRLICFGETATSCVPNVATHFRTLLDIKQPAIVPLELTNARRDGRWQGCREGGGELEYVREEFPTITFIAIPSDFGPLPPPTKKIQTV
jgi:hypothetical protein